VCLAAVFRFPALDGLPPALFRDEIEKGYTAWELAATGRYGRLSMTVGGTVIPSERFPFFIDVYGVRTSSLYQWLSIPFMAVGGLNGWTTRLPAAVAGVMAVWFTFLWVRRVWGTRTALWAGFWLALSPWHVVFSRWAQQGITEPLWLVLALYCFQKGRSPVATDRHRAFWWAASGVFAAVAFYAYAVGRVFVPVWLIALGLSHLRLLRRHSGAAALAGGVFLVLAIPVAWVSLGAEGAARFDRISVFGQTSSTGAALALFLKNWLRHFDLRFLFLSGDANPRHQLPGLGVMFLAQAPLVVFGLLGLIRRRRPVDVFLLLWLALFPVSASLTAEGVPHALRAIVGLPAWPVLTGIGTAVLFRLVAGLPRSDAVRRLAGALLVLVLVVPAALSLSRALYHRWPAAAAMDFEWTAQTITLALLNSDGNRVRAGGNDSASVIDARIGASTETGPQSPSETSLDSVPELPPVSSASPGRWLSGYVPYAPHRLLFHGQVDPRTWQARGLEALPARLLPPAPLSDFWSRIRAGDRLGLLEPDLGTLPPAAYTVELSIPLPPELGGQGEELGAVVLKTK